MGRKAKVWWFLQNRGHDQNDNEPSSSKGIFQTSSKLFVLCLSISYLTTPMRKMITWPKFTWSKLCFFTWSKVLIMKVLYFITWSNYLRLFSWSKVLLMSFWVILNFRSTAKKEPTDFGSWSKLFKSIKYHY